MLPVPNSPYGLRKSMGPSWVSNSPYDLSGRKATLNLNWSVFRSFVKVDVAVVVPPYLIVLMSSLDVKQH